MSISLNDLANRLKNVESVKSSWTKGSNSNGNWCRESSTGLLIQWGISGSGNATRTVTFPTKFNSNPIVQAIMHVNASYQQVCITVNPNTTSFTLMQPGKGASATGWLAIGYLVSNRIKSLFKEVISYVDLLK